MCVDIHPNDEMIITGGVDSDAVVFNRIDNKVMSRLSGHSKAVTDVMFHPSQDILFTTSKDKTAKLWTPSENGHTAAHTVTVHDGEVTGCTLHPTGSYWITSSLDNTWAFHDIETSNTLVRVAAPAGCSCVSFHPDGLILGTGTGSEVKIWDIKTQKNVANFEGHSGKVTGLSFSENGFYLASCSASTVKLWDLRKLKPVHEIVSAEAGNLNGLAWDYSGTYLAVAGDDIRVYTGKAFSHIATYKQHNKAVTGVAWGSAAQFLVSTSLDRTTKIWGPK
jgi:pre-mRNA-processing factor 19